MIFLPPRHGKSELVTNRYAAWRLLNNPDMNIIIGSYNQRLANRFSRKIRITLEDTHECGSERQHRRDAETRRKERLKESQHSQSNSERSMIMKLKSVRPSSSSGFFSASRRLGGSRGPPALASTQSPNGKPAPAEEVSEQSVSAAE